MLTYPGGGRGRGRSRMALVTVVLCMVVLLGWVEVVEASIGDRLPEFTDCVQICERENCGPDATHSTPIPLLHRLLLWSCPAECDYTCQHIVTSSRLAAPDPPGPPHYPQPVVQYHGKWPFYRFLGMQEPLSVICSAGNLWGHYNGLHNRVLTNIPERYTLRPFYVWLAYIGMASWTFSIIFHTRDFPITEKLDYFGAGASVLYGLYYTSVRLFRLDLERKRGVLKVWTAVCVGMYICHVMYLSLWRWDYTYNMAANVACGIVQNAMWSWFSYDRYRKSRRAWAVWPGLVVAWVIMAMSLELLDFPPLWGVVDAHSLWHLGTIAPTVLWYNFLVKDAQDDLAGSDRLKA